MIERRAFILAVSFLALTACSSSGAVGGEKVDSAVDVQEPRAHIGREDIVGAFFFSLDGSSVSPIDKSTLTEIADAVSALDLVTSDNPATIPEGGFAGGRDLMFLLILSSASAVTIGTAGQLAIYNSVPYESSYEACQKISDMYARLIEE